MQMSVRLPRIDAHTNVPSRHIQRRLSSRCVFDVGSMLMQSAQWRDGVCISDPLPCPAPRSLFEEAAPSEVVALTNREPKWNDMLQVSSLIEFFVGTTRIMCRVPHSQTPRTSPVPCSPLRHTNTGLLPQLWWTRDLCLREKLSARGPWPAGKRDGWADGAP